MRALGVALAEWLEAHDIAQDILGQNIYSNWLSPESGERVSLVEEPPVSARISGAVLRTGDHPRGRLNSATTFDEATPTADAGGVSNLGSTLRPDTLSVRPKTSTRWLVPALGGGLLLVGALAWALWPHAEAGPPASATQAAPQVTAADNAEHQAVAAETNAPAAPAASATADEAPAPSASAEEAGKPSARAERSAKSAKAAVNEKPTEAPKEKPAAAEPEAKPARKPAEPGKPKLGSDLGF